MRPLSLILYLVAGINLTFGGLVFYYGRRIRTNQFFFALAVLLAVWAVFHGRSITATTNASALFWGQMIMIPGSLLPFTFLRFAQELTKESFARRGMPLLHYVAMAFFLLFLFDARFTASAEIAPWGVNWKPGPIFFVYGVYFLFTMGQGIGLLVKTIRRTEGQQRRQLVYVFFGSALSIGAGLVVNILHPILGITAFNKYGPLGTIFLVGFVAYAILKHRLMEINIVIRRTALFLGIYGVLGTVVFAVIYALNQQLFVADPAPAKALAYEIVVVGIFFSLGAFLYGALVRRSLFFHETTMAGITHELKSPLATIESALELMVETAGPQQMNEQQTAYVDMINRNSIRLRNFVNDLLVVMETGAETPALTREKLDVSQLAASLVDDMRAAAREKGIAIRLTQPAQPLVIQADKTRLSQIISNLLSNAIKFTPEGAISVAVEAGPKDLTVTVSDTGHGMSPKEIPFIFDRFFQGDAGKRSKGTGLGLAIAKTWVEAHGGEIRAESDGPGKGSRFWFTIPAGRGL